MSVGRNDPCPCGSGNKYKKCCMKKNNLIMLEDFKEERFYRQKHLLVNKIQDFINEQVPASNYYRLESQFKKRAKLKTGMELNVLFGFWLYFFYRHENGMRGIEWFLQEKGSRLSEEELKMAKLWSELKPKLVQAVNKTDSHVTFKDIFTKETYNVSTYHENLPEFAPWFSTLSLLEPMEGLYYFNGVRPQSSPKGFYNAVNLVQKLMEQTGLGHEQVLLEYYPEVLVALRDDKEATDAVEKEFVQYTYKFLLKDRVKGENFLYNDDSFAIETWEKNIKKLVWLDNLQVYTDSELQSSMRLADVLATLEVKNEKLTFVSSSLEIVNEFLKKLNRAEGAFQLVDDQVQRILLPISVDVKQTTVSMGKDVPQYFALYAQSNGIADIDEPIPMYDNLSLKELVSTGREDLAEVWLKQSEFHLYHHVYKQYGEVEITADFNTVRRELGLELSPFVTGGEQRHSELLPVTQKEQRKNVILEEEIPIYEALGFSPETIDNFYTKDLIAFYKEKTYGKSEGTERKYRYSLYDIREALERSSLKSWDECNASFWDEFLSKGFLEINNNRVNQTMVKEINATVKALTKWLEKLGKVKG